MYSADPFLHCSSSTPLIIFPSTPPRLLCTSLPLLRSSSCPPTLHIYSSLLPSPLLASRQLKEEMWNWPVLLLLLPRVNRDPSSSSTSLLPPFSHPPTAVPSWRRLIWPLERKDKKKNNTLRKNNPLHPRLFFSSSLNNNPPVPSDAHLKYDSSPEGRRGRPQGKHISLSWDTNQYVSRLIYLNPISREAKGGAALHPWRQRGGLGDGGCAEREVRGRQGLHPMKVRQSAGLHW